MGEKTIGIISGFGELPRFVAEEARAKGYRVIIIALKPLADESLIEFADEFKAVNVARFGELIRSLKRFHVAQAVMAGKVSKTMLYKGMGRELIPDVKAVKLLLSLKDRKDDSILLAIAKELENDGIKLLETTRFTERLLTAEGVLSKRRPARQEWKDIQFGFAIAKEIGRLDIGQTVVVKAQAVMAVEAIEGTDEAIKRGGGLAGEGAAVVKVSKPRQDMRFDVPTVGLETISAMASVRAKAIGLEAGKTIIVDKDTFLKKADEAGITVVGIVQPSG